jgi:nucleotide-binding universal stress UspA family protein
MNKLLVPFDFSVYAENALNYAVALASQINASVTVFHTFQVKDLVPAVGKTGTSTTYSQAIADKEKNVLNNKLTEVLHKFSNKFYLEKPEKIKFETFVRDGNFEELVQRHLQHTNYNLIVMGTKGAFGWEEAISGSNTSQIAKKINANVLVVPIEGVYEGIHHMIYASDFDKQDTDKLNQVITFNDFFEARITCLHVTDDASKVERDHNKMKELENKFQNIGKNIQFAQILDIEVEDAIFDYAEKVDAEILVVNPKERSVIGGFFHESMTNKMTMHTSMPLLVVK